jgi:tripartite-type tricarboxylate transporter receptor subunit TctC
VKAPVRTRIIELATVATLTTVATVAAVATSAARALAPLGVALAVLSSAPVHAADWPQRPIRLLVGFAAGGGVDQLARGLGENLSRSLGQPVVIDNRPGAGTTIAATALSRAPADGYTLMLMSSTNTIAPALYKSLPYDAIKDFRMVSMIASGPIILAVPPDSPIRTVADLIAESRAKPGGVNYGAGGIATSMHLAALLLEQQLGVPMTHIVYKGGAETTTALLGQQIDLMLVSPPTFAPVAARSRAIGVTTARRFSGLPDVPTLAESGVAGFDVSSWYALAAPRGLPDAIGERLGKAVSAAMSDPAMRQRFAELGVEATPSTADEATAVLASETNRWDGVVRTAGLAGAQ